ncbi:MAG TPA: Bax inhibitor-1/YccA family protein [Xanthobacteraceae bacterium]|jgi:FtsH-binding integral membrane protein|nr:Bax inhibitor-1/YccA family protein [Xanthobacteraceae bacterium]
MSDFDRHAATARSGYGADRALVYDAGLRAHMVRVYNYMAGAVALTGIVAYVMFNMVAVTGPDGNLVGLTALGQTLFRSPMMWVIALAPLALVFFISFRIDRLSLSTALALFFGYAALLGLSLTTIFFAYTGTSITRVFFISAASFGALSLYGYTTQRNLSAMGSFLIMGLIGVIIASIVNIFLVSSALQFAISVIGVLVFAGLTAWDTQKIKEMYDVNDDGTVSGRKAVMGALSLYLDFINLFLMMLRLFGDRR